MKKLFAIMLLLLGAAQGIHAQEPYAVLSDDNTTLTFYYDNNKEANEGMDVGPFTYEINWSTYLPEVSSEWYKVRKNITTVVFDKSFAGCNSINSTAYWFYECKALETIKDIENLNTANVTDMSRMFSGCSGLTKLDVSNFNTSSVTDMTQMFFGCSKLKSLDVSNFNTSSVTSMSGLFCRCSSLTSLDVSKFNTANVISLSTLFSGCSSLTSLDVSNFNTATVTDMSSMFNSCSSLTSLNVSNFNTANVTSMNQMFSGCSSLTNLNVSNFNTANVTDMCGLFRDCSGLVSLDVTNFNTENVTSYTGMNGMFEGCSSLTSLDVSNFDTENVTAMSNMFHNCSALTTIYCEETWNCSTSDDMFEGCTSLKGTINYDSSNTDVTYANSTNGYFTSTGKPVLRRYAALSDDKTTLTFYYDTNKKSNGGMSFGLFSYSNGIVNSGWYEWREKITTVVFDKSFADCTSIQSTAYWFCNCNNLIAINGIENLKTPYVTVMDGMFEGCKSLKSLDVSNFNTAKVVYMQNMFLNCSSLTSLDVKNFNTEKVGHMVNMFYGCSGLTSLDVSNFNTVNVESMGGMFQGCSNLTNLNVSNFNTKNVTDMDVMFYGCSSLSNIDVSNFNTEKVKYMSGMFYNCSQMTTIYCNDAWTCSDDSGAMFYGCTSLKGAISYDSEKTDVTYANPTTGYFTRKNAILLGDANGDGVINYADVTTVKDYIMGNEPENFVFEGADANEDGKVNVADIVIILNKKE